MRYRGRPYQSEKDVGESRVTGRRAWNRKDCPRPRNQPGAGYEGSIPPNRRERDLLCGGEEDGGVDGEFQEGYWYASPPSLTGPWIADRHGFRPGLRVKETKEVYEGEVTDLTPEESENPLGGYGKTISHVIVGLKSAKGTKKLRLDPSIYESIQKERVAIGDVIYIEANTGAVKRVGRSDAYATEFDLEAEEYVPIPKGEVHKKKEIVQDVTLHDLDIANARPQVHPPPSTSPVASPC